jgi:hypothetical protein
MFEESERSYRDEEYRQSIICATKVVLLSDTVKNDFEEFAPNFIHKACTVRPITYVPESTYQTDPVSVAALYHLPKKFIFLPNQFWRHKNHLIAFEAVRTLLRACGSNFLFGAFGIKSFTLV